ncbi:MAG: DUF4286 family protein [Bacteroidia bacterium]|nr:DUF4286 family protein [Bacteroidia bacterium]
MIIYNVTVNINDEVHADWVNWMKSVHIPDVMKTGYFKEYRFSKVLSDDPQGQTYSIQYICNDLTDYDNYQKKEAPRLQADHTNRYKDKFIAFRTILKVVDHG